MTELDDAKTKLESLVVYLAKQRHAAKENYVQADNALTDITSVLVTIENALATPIGIVDRHTPLYDIVQPVPPSPVPRYDYLADPANQPINLDVQ